MKVLRILGGFCLILIGLVGLIMPIMPGWVFIIPGLVILADYFPSVRRLVDWAKAKLEGATGQTGGTSEMPDDPNLRK
ncbi:MAG TPA: PGPGW domain-containing protein [Bryobacteraceae bacterium]|nr:PGPGW domain-containing protein [Bryobacteraceae bacterium]